MQAKLIKAKNRCRKLREENSSDRKKPPRSLLLSWCGRPCLGRPLCMELRVGDPAWGGLCAWN